MCVRALACFLCLCIWYIFVRTPAISHPAAYQSSPLCSSVYIDLLPPSLTLRLIHASAGQGKGLWHSEGNVTAVTSETDTLPLKDIAEVASLTARREQRDTRREG